MTFLLPPGIKGLIHTVLHCFIQKQTRLFLTQPLIIFYILKDLKDLFFIRKDLVFICNSLILSEFPLFFYIYICFSFQFFNFLIYFAILYINIKCKPLFWLLVLRYFIVVTELSKAFSIYPSCLRKASCVHVDSISTWRRELFIADQHNEVLYFDSFTILVLTVYISNFNDKIILKIHFD